MTKTAEPGLILWIRRTSLTLEKIWATRKQHQRAASDPFIGSIGKLSAVSPPISDRSVLNRVKTGERSENTG